ncbi:hypothetical protein B0E33_26070 [Roseibium algicola]|jgi:hypothetical protein|uniref:Uncharacterized protein n=1 Tax=Roseibium algicola TaxID=2857014 RepID=A0ABM6I839_9HYPH|nr:hypothetical protein B0E33_26070 [Roseibium aggregatum]
MFSFSRGMILDLPPIEQKRTRVAITLRTGKPKSLPKFVKGRLAAAARRLYDPPAPAKAGPEFSR